MTLPPQWRRRLWALLAVGGATLPVARGLAGLGIFYVRDLSLIFWGRHVWLRRELFSGHFPLWDPYVGAGQSAAADALRQLFLPPALLLRLIGSEVFGFNLWVAMPFPLAALGAWLFFAARFSAPAATLGAMAFAVSGPVIATGNFPNMSWSVAAVPWVLWAVDRAASAPTPRRVAALAVAVAMQAAAGEPVTMLATLVTAGAMAIILNGSLWIAHRARIVHVASLAGGVVLGLGLAAVQLVPLGRAAAQSERATAAGYDFWSFHPMALFETISPHLFGDYYTVASLRETPWLPPLNSGREPFFFSIYFGVPLLVLAGVGLMSSRPVRWTWFWAAVAVVSVVSAFGANTPIYPFLRAHLPLLASFRFPVKYLILTSMSVAALAAAGWDVLAGESIPAADRRRAGVGGVVVALVIAAGAAATAAICMNAPHWAAFRLLAIARSVAAADPAAAAEFMFLALPSAASLILLLSALTAATLWLGARDGREAAGARAVLFACIAIDLVVRAAGVNPVLNPAYLEQPQWLSHISAEPDARFYIGGKREGTLDPSDLDSSGAYRNSPGLSGAASRAALSTQADFSPSAWRTREMLTYDLAVLWPRWFETMTQRFINGGRHDRDQLLERSGVRYRVLPLRLAAGHAPIMQLPLLYESYLFDWGGDVARRVSVVGAATVLPGADAGVNALFDDGWDHRTTAIVERATDAAGDAGSPVAPSARILVDTANRVTVEAGAGAGGGYLVMLDSYTEDWRASVDGRPAALTRANGLFRGVHLAPGRHLVEFVYRPRAVLVGAAVSAVALAILLGLTLVPARRQETWA